MKNRKKRAQREEVRKILQTMRLELAAQRLAQEKSERPNATLRLHELMKQSTQSLVR